MNLPRAWDIFVAEAARVGVSVESARRVLEPALRAVLVDVEAQAPELIHVVRVTPKGPRADHRRKPDAFFERVLEACKSLKSNAKVSEEFGCSESYVWKVRHGWKPSTREALTDEVLGKVFADIVAGYGNREIQARTGVHHVTVGGIRHGRTHRIRFQVWRHAHAAERGGKEAA